MENIMKDAENYLPNLFDRVCKDGRVQNTVLPIFGCEEMSFRFKKQNTLEDRTLIFDELLKKHPGKIPVIVEHPSNKKILKFLMDYDEVVMTLLVKIRSHFEIPLKKSIFLLSGNKRMLMGSQKIGEVYQEYLLESDDRFLYVMVCFENTFGFKETNK